MTPIADTSCIRCPPSARLVGCVLTLGIALLGFCPTAGWAADWSATEARANGQTVYWDMWGGDAQVNAYAAWAAAAVRTRYGVDVHIVKLADAAEAVAQVLAEKSAGRIQDGKIDVIWLNGENFAAMKRNTLLWGPFVAALPNASLVDTQGKATTEVDFTVPTEGYEAPWGMAQFVVMYDSKLLPSPPRSILALAAWVQQHPGRFTYPAPPDFIGLTFLKQALLVLSAAPERFQRPVDESDFAVATAPLWRFLDAINPYLWRSGRAFPVNGPAQRQLLADAEIDLALTFNPADASNGIASGLLPETVRIFVPDGHSIGNTHFLAIPYDSSVKEGAQVLINFLLSPEAQLRKQDPKIWGDPTVLDLAKLSPDDRARFERIYRGVATLTPADIGTPLPEPHPSWVVAIEREWQRRYGSGVRR
ncbi:MAG: transporter, periplasmic substrate-binding protein YnjB [Rhodospirillales bacterium]|nr:transporter, periplasmic substrate-binding protein YnjB [Rhodospirillales bacterium]